MWLCLCALSVFLQAVLDGEDAIRQWLDYNHVPAQQVCNTGYAGVARLEVGLDMYTAMTVSLNHAFFA